MVIKVSLMAIRDDIFVPKQFTLRHARLYDALVESDSFDLDVLRAVDAFNNRLGEYYDQADSKRVIAQEKKVKVEERQNILTLAEKKLKAKTLSKEDAVAYNRLKVEIMRQKTLLHKAVAERDGLLKLVPQHNCGKKCVYASIEEKIDVAVKAKRQVQSRLDKMKNRLHKLAGEIVGCKRATAKTQWNWYKMMDIKGFVHTDVGYVRYGMSRAQRKVRNRRAAEYRAGTFKVTDENRFAWLPPVHSSTRERYAGGVWPMPKPTPRPTWRETPEERRARIAAKAERKAQRYARSMRAHKPTRREREAELQQEVWEARHKAAAEALAIRREEATNAFYAREAARRERAEKRSARLTALWEKRTAERAARAAAINDAYHARKQTKRHKDRTIPMRNDGYHLKMPVARPQISLEKWLEPLNLKVVENKPQKMVEKLPLVIELADNNPTWEKKTTTYARVPVHTDNEKSMLTCGLCRKATVLDGSYDQLPKWACANWLCRNFRRNGPEDSWRKYSSGKLAVWEDYGNAKLVKRLDVNSDIQTFDHLRICQNVWHSRAIEVRGAGDFTIEDGKVLNPFVGRHQNFFRSEVNLQSGENILSNGTVVGQITYAFKVGGEQCYCINNSRCFDGPLVSAADWEEHSNLLFFLLPAVSGLLFEPEVIGDHMCVVGRDEPGGSILLAPKHCMKTGREIAPDINGFAALAPVGEAVVVENKTYYTHIAGYMHITGESHVYGVPTFMTGEYFPSGTPIYDQDGKLVSIVTVRSESGFYAISTSVRADISCEKCSTTDIVESSEVTLRRALWDPSWRLVRGSKGPCVYKHRMGYPVMCPVDCIQECGVDHGGVQYDQDEFEVAYPTKLELYDGTHILPEGPLTTICGETKCHILRGYRIPFPVIRGTPVYSNGGLAGMVVLIEKGLNYVHIPYQFGHVVCQSNGTFCAFDYMMNIQLQTPLWVQEFDAIIANVALPAIIVEDDKQKAIESMAINAEKIGRLALAEKLLRENKNSLPEKEFDKIEKRLQLVTKRFNNAITGQEKHIERMTKAAEEVGELVNELIPLIQANAALREEKRAVIENGNDSGLLPVADWLGEHAPNVAIVEGLHDKTILKRLKRQLTEENMIIKSHDAIAKTVTTLQDYSCPEMVVEVDRESDKGLFNITMTGEQQTIAVENGIIKLVSGKYNARDASCVARIFDGKFIGHLILPANDCGDNLNINRAVTLRRLRCAHDALTTLQRYSREYISIFTISAHHILIWIAIGLLATYTLLKKNWIITCIVIAGCVDAVTSDCLNDAYVYNANKIEGTKYTIEGMWRVGDCVRFGNSTLRVNKIEAIAFYTPGSHIAANITFRSKHDYGCPGGTSSGICDQAIKCDANDIINPHSVCTNAYNSAWWGTDCAVGGQVYIHSVLCMRAVGTMRILSKSTVESKYRISFTISDHERTNEFTASQQEFDGIVVSNIITPSFGFPSIMVATDHSTYAVLEQGLIDKAIKCVNPKCDEFASQQFIPSFGLENAVQDNQHVSYKLEDYAFALALGTDQCPLIDGVGIQDQGGWKYVHNLTAFSAKIAVDQHIADTTAGLCISVKVILSSVTPGVSGNYKTSKVAFRNVEQNCTLLIECDSCYVIDYNRKIVRGITTFEVLCGVYSSTNCSFTGKLGSDTLNIVKLARNPTYAPNKKLAELHDKIRPAYDFFRNIGKEVVGLGNWVSDLVHWPIRWIIKIALSAIFMLLSLQAFGTKQYTLLAIFSMMTVLPLVVGEPVCVRWEADCFGMQIPRELCEEGKKHSLHGLWNLPNKGKLPCNRTEAAFYARRSSQYWIERVAINSYCKHGYHQGYTAPEYFDLVEKMCHNFDYAHQCRFDGQCDVAQQTSTVQLPEIGCKHSCNAGYNLAIPFRLVVAGGLISQLPTTVRGGLLHNVVIGIHALSTSAESFMDEVVRSTYDNVSANMTTLYHVVLAIIAIYSLYVVVIFYVCANIGDILDLCMYSAQGSFKKTARPGMLTHFMAMMWPKKKEQNCHKVIYHSDYKMSAKALVDKLRNANDAKNISIKIGGQHCFYAHKIDELVITAAHCVENDNQGFVHGDVYIYSPENFEIDVALANKFAHCYYYRRLPNMRPGDSGKIFEDDRGTYMHSGVLQNGAPVCCFCQFVCKNHMDTPGGKNAKKVTRDYWDNVAPAGSRAPVVRKNAVVFEKKSGNDTVRLVQHHGTTTSHIIGGIGEPIVPQKFKIGKATKRLEDEKGTWFCRILQDEFSSHNPKWPKMVAGMTEIKYLRKLEEMNPGIVEKVYYRFLEKAERYKKYEAKPTLDAKMRQMALFNLERKPIEIANAQARKDAAIERLPVTPVKTNTGTLLTIKSEKPLKSITYHSRFPSPMHMAGERRTRYRYGDVESYLLLPGVRDETHVYVKGTKVVVDSYLAGSYWYSDGINYLSISRGFYHPENLSCKTPIWSERGQLLSVVAQSFNNYYPIIGESSTNHRWRGRPCTNEQIRQGFPVDFVCDTYHSDADEFFKEYVETQEYVYHIGHLMRNSPYTKRVPPPPAGKTRYEALVDALHNIEERKINYLSSVVPVEEEIPDGVDDATLQQLDQLRQLYDIEDLLNGECSRGTAATDCEEVKQDYIVPTNVIEDTPSPERIREIIEYQGIGTNSPVTCPPIGHKFDQDIAYPHWLTQPNTTYVMHIGGLVRGYCFAYSGGVYTNTHVTRGANLVIPYNSDATGNPLSFHNMAERFYVTLKENKSTSAAGADLTVYTFCQKRREWAKPQPGGIYFVLDIAKNRFMTVQYLGTKSMATDAMSDIFRAIDVSTEENRLIPWHISCSGLSGSPILNGSGMPVGIYGNNRISNQFSDDKIEIVCSTTPNAAGLNTKMREINLKPILEEILGGHHAGAHALLSAPTGSGKSTSVPVGLARHHHELTGRPVRYTVLIPTRKCCDMLYEYMSSRVATDETWQTTVNIEKIHGHSPLTSTWKKSTTPPITICYTTYGHGVGMEHHEFGDLLFLDESHTRHHEQLLALESNLEREKRYNYVLMSATPFGGADNCVHISLPATSPHEVHDRQLEVWKDGSEATHVKVLASKSKIYYAVPKISNGNMLIFHATIDEAKNQCASLREQGVDAIELHGNASDTITGLNYICCTDIVESSATIPDCVTVVDFLYTNKPTVRVDINAEGVYVEEKMEIIPINKYQSQQRRGRTGRMCDGDYYTPTTVKFPISEAYPESAVYKAALLLLSKKKADLYNASLVQAGDIGNRVYEKYLEIHPRTIAAWHKGDRVGNEEYERKMYERAFTLLKNYRNVPVMTMYFSRVLPAIYCDTAFDRYILESPETCSIRLNATFEGDALIPDKLFIPTNSQLGITIGGTPAIMFDPAYIEEYEDNEELKEAEKFAARIKNFRLASINKDIVMQRGALNNPYLLSALGIGFGTWVCSQVVAEYYAPRKVDKILRIAQSSDDLALSMEQAIKGMDYMTLEHFKSKSSCSWGFIKTLWISIKDVVMKTLEWMAKRFGQEKWAGYFESKCQRSDKDWTQIVAFYWETIADKSQTITIDEIQQIGMYGAVPIISAFYQKLAENYGEITSTVALSIVSCIAKETIGTQAYLLSAFVGIIGNMIAVKFERGLDEDNFSGSFFMGSVLIPAVLHYAGPILTKTPVTNVQNNIEVINGYVTSSSAYSILYGTGGIDSGMALGFEAVRMMWEGPQGSGIVDKGGALLSLITRGMMVYNLSKEGVIALIATGAFDFVFRKCMHTIKNRPYRGCENMRIDKEFQKEIFDAEQQEHRAPAELVEKFYEAVKILLGTYYNPFGAICAIIVLGEHVVSRWRNGQDVEFKSAWKHASNAVWMSPLWGVLTVVIKVVTTMQDGLEAVYTSGDGFVHNIINRLTSVQRSESFFNDLKVHISNGWEYISAMGHGLKKPFMWLMEKFAAACIWGYRQLTRLLTAGLRKLKSFARNVVLSAFPRTFVSLLEWLGPSSTVTDSDAFDPNVSELQIRKFLHMYGYAPFVRYYENMKKSRLLYNPFHPWIGSGKLEYLKFYRYAAQLGIAYDNGDLAYVTNTMKGGERVRACSLSSYQTKDLFDQIIHTAAIEMVKNSDNTDYLSNFKPIVRSKLCAFKACGENLVVAYNDLENREFFVMYILQRTDENAGMSLVITNAVDTWGEPATPNDPQLKLMDQINKRWTNKTPKRSLVYPKDYDIVFETFVKRADPEKLYDNISCVIDMATNIHPIDIHLMRMDLSVDKKVDMLLSAIRSEKFEWTKLNHLHARYDFLNEIVDKGNFYEAPKIDGRHLASRMSEIKTCVPIHGIRKLFYMMAHGDSVDSRQVMVLLNLAYGMAIRNIGEQTTEYSHYSACQKHFIAFRGSSKTYDCCGINVRAPEKILPGKNTALVDGTPVYVGKRLPLGEYRLCTGEQQAVDINQVVNDGEQNIFFEIEGLKYKLNLGDFDRPIEGGRVIYPKVNARIDYHILKSLLRVSALPGLNTSKVYVIDNRDKTAYKVTSLFVGIFEQYLYEFYFEVVDDPKEALAELFKHEVVDIYAVMETMICPVVIEDIRMGQVDHQVAPTATLKRVVLDTPCQALVRPEKMNVTMTYQHAGGKLEDVELVHNDGLKSFHCIANSWEREVVAKAAFKGVEKLTPKQRNAFFNTIYEGPKRQGVVMTLPKQQHISFLNNTVKNIFKNVRKVDTVDDLLSPVRDNPPPKVEMLLNHEQPIYEVTDDEERAFAAAEKEKILGMKPHELLEFTPTYAANCLQYDLRRYAGMVPEDARGDENYQQFQQKRNVTFCKACCGLPTIKNAYKGLNLREQFGDIAMRSWINRIALQHDLDDQVTERHDHGSCLPRPTTPEERAETATIVHRGSSWLTVLSNLMQRDKLITKSRLNENTIRTDGTLAKVLAHDRLTKPIADRLVATIPIRPVNFVESSALNFEEPKNNFLVIEHDLNREYMKKLSPPKGTADLPPGVGIIPLNMTTPIDKPIEPKTKDDFDQLNRIAHVKGQVWDVLKRYERVYMPSNTQAPTMSRAYYKMSLIDRHTNVMFKSKRVLDMTAGSGGFIQYYITNQPGRGVRHYYANTLVRPGHSLISREHLNHTLRNAEHTNTRVTLLNANGHSADMRYKEIYDQARKISAAKPFDLLIMDFGEANGSLDKEGNYLNQKLPFADKVESFCDTPAQAVEEYVKLLVTGGNFLFKAMGFTHHMKKLIRRYGKYFSKMIAYKCPTSSLLSREYYILFIGKKEKPSEEWSNIDNWLGHIHYKWHIQMRRAVEYVLKNHKQLAGDLSKHGPEGLGLGLDVKTRTLQNVIEEDGRQDAHIHQCVKCNQMYIHVHAFNKTNHRQQEYQCPYEDCEWYHGAGNLYNNSGSKKINFHPRQAQRLAKPRFEVPTIPYTWNLPNLGWQELGNKRVRDLIKDNTMSISDQYMCKDVEEIMGITFRPRIKERLALFAEEMRKKGRSFEPATGRFAQVQELGRLDVREKFGRERHTHNHMINDMAFRVFGQTIYTSTVGHTQTDLEHLIASEKKRLDLHPKEPGPAEAELLRSAAEASRTPEYWKIANGPESKKFAPWTYEQTLAFVHKQGAGTPFDKWHNFEAALADPAFKIEQQQLFDALKAGKTVGSYMYCNPKNESKEKKISNDGLIEVPKELQYDKSLPRSVNDDRREKRKTFLHESSLIAPRWIQYSNLAQRFVDLRMLAPMQQYHNNDHKLYMGSTAGTPFWKLGDILHACYEQFCSPDEQEFLVGDKIIEENRRKFSKKFLAAFDSRNIKLDWKKDWSITQLKRLQKNFKFLISSGDYSGYDGTISNTDHAIMLRLTLNITQSQFHQMFIERWTYYMWSIVVNGRGAVILRVAQRGSGDQMTSFDNTAINDMYHVAATAISQQRTCADVCKIVGTIKYKVSFNPDDKHYKTFYLRDMINWADGDDNGHISDEKSIRLLDKNGIQFLESCGKKIRCGNRPGYEIGTRFEHINFCSHRFVRVRIGLDQNINALDIFHRPDRLHDKHTDEASQLTRELVDKFVTQKCGKDAPILRQWSLVHQHVYDALNDIKITYLPIRALSTIIGKLTYTIKSEVMDFSFNRDYDKTPKGERIGRRNERAFEITRGKILAYLLNYSHLETVRNMCYALLSCIGDGTCNIIELSRRYFIPSTTASCLSAMKSVHGVTDLDQVECVPRAWDRKQLETIRANTSHIFEKLHLKDSTPVAQTDPVAVKNQLSSWTERFCADNGIKPDNYWFSRLEAIKGVTPPKDPPKRRQPTKAAYIKAFFWNAFISSFLPPKRYLIAVSEKFTDFGAIERRLGLPGLTNLFQKEMRYTLRIGQTKIIKHNGVQVTLICCGKDGEVSRAGIALCLADVHDKHVLVPMGLCRKASDFIRGCPLAKRHLLQVKEIDIVSRSTLNTGV